jgi:hypothetical protein
MRKARDAAIRSRLEATKCHGLVEDYRIEWQAGAFAAPQITVQGRSTLPTVVTKNYLTVLLERFVPSRAIVVL